MKKQPFLHSFRYAVQGVRTALREERNLRFHVCAAFYVYLFSLFYEFTRVEYCLITIMVGGVMALELVNSSLERAVERPCLLYTSTQKLCPHDTPAYYPHTALRKHLPRRSCCHRGIFHSQEVIDCINGRLKATWSPEQIARVPCELQMPGVPSAGGAAKNTC